MRGGNQVGQRSNVRFGSKADISASPHHVRFTPKADIAPAIMSTRPNSHIKSSSLGPDTRERILRRLRRDRPDLAEQVEAGKISARAAGIEAGFRKKPAAGDRG
jgi:hypothetical protein